MHEQISHKYECIFIHIPKTAGTTIEVSPIFDENRRKGDNPGGHTTALQFKSMFPEKYETYFKFAVVRNPWDRLVSAYFHFLQSTNRYEKEIVQEYLNQTKTFGDFCKNVLNEQFMHNIIHLKPQYHFLNNESGDFIVDYVGRFESLREDIKYICQQLGVSFSPKHKRISRHKHYSKYYTNETKEIVKHLYNEDIELFRYKFETGARRNISYYLNWIPHEARQLLKKVILCTYDVANYSRRIL